MFRSESLAHMGVGKKLWQRYSLVINPRSEWWFRRSVPKNKLWEVAPVIAVSHLLNTPLALSKNME